VTTVQNDKSKAYKDIRSCLQVIGALMKKPELLDSDGRHFFKAEDFTEDLHRVVYGAINNLYQMGATNITVQAIEDYLASKPNSLAIYRANKGDEWLDEVVHSTDEMNFEYYYQRMKKMTLLRVYAEMGVDVTWFYDPDEIFDLQKKNEQELRFENTKIEEIADLFEKKLFDARVSCVDNAVDDSVLLGDGALELVESFQEAPEMGINMYGKLINTITRGARTGKFYLRSAPTGVGKSRTMVADACTFACSEIYDVSSGSWVPTGNGLPTLFISIELDKSEMTTMALAFLSGVDEGHILDYKYNFGEHDRVVHAAEVLAKSPLYFEYLPDYSLKDIENIVKIHIRQDKCQYVVLDYIATSMKIIEEIASRSGVKIREDQVLFLLSSKLKDICCQFGVFILSATQLSQGWQDENTIPDQNLLRSSKAIADAA
jgi:replicative DNA helicase